MRVMVIVKATENSETGGMPPAESWRTWALSTRR